MILRSPRGNARVGADWGAKARADFENYFPQRSAGLCLGHYQSRFRPYSIRLKCVFGIKRGGGRKNFYKIRLEGLTYTTLYEIIGLSN